MRNAAMQVYLDNSATTKPCERAVTAMARSMRDGYYNPSALYGQAVAVERELTEARQTVAMSVQADERNVIFTSGGTESDNLAILGYLQGVRELGEVLYTAAEHPAVRNACLEAATRFGHKARVIPLNARGNVDLSALECMLNPSVRMICAMQVCNETGAILPIGDIAALRDRLAPAAALHVDGVQGYLRLPFSMRALNVQSYAVSAHKIHGPKGIGALIVREGHRLHPQMAGGGQQNNLRSGTENTTGILGFAAAVADYPETETARMRLSGLKSLSAETLQSQIPEMRILGPLPGESDSAPHILYAAFPPVRAETLVHALEAEGVMVGTGSACSSRKHKRSEVLTAMGVSAALIDSSIRLSFSVQNTPEEIRYAAEQIAQKYRLLAPFTRR